LIEAHHPPSSASNISLHPEAHSKSLLKLSKDEVFEARVLKSFSSDTALLLIKGTRVMARTYAPLREGKVLSLKVEEISPTPTLKLLGIELPDSNTLNISTVLSAIKENLWKSLFENIHLYGLSKKALSLFRELINDLSLRLFLKPPPGLLRILIEKSGLSWEAKLRRLLTNKGIGGDNLNKLVEGDLKGLISRFLALGGEKQVLLKRFVSTIKNISFSISLGLSRTGRFSSQFQFNFPMGFLPLASC